MKKIIALAVLFAMLASTACATDLSSLSYAELLVLRDQCQRELMTRPEWKEVTVPAGTWTVGVDIPAGSYSITDATGVHALKQLWKVAVDDHSNNGMILNTTADVGKITAVDGNVFFFNRAVIMTPVKGLGF